MPESRKNSKPEKCLKNAQNPTCRVHALLDPAFDLQDSLPELNTRISGKIHLPFSKMEFDKDE
jgi:hypothetical protein